MAFCSWLFVRVFRVQRGALTFPLLCSMRVGESFSTPPTKLVDAYFDRGSYIRPVKNAMGSAQGPHWFQTTLLSDNQVQERSDAFCLCVCVCARVYLCNQSYRKSPKCYASPM